MRRFVHLSVSCLLLGAGCASADRMASRTDTLSPQAKKDLAEAGLPPPAKKPTAPVVTNPAVEEQIRIGQSEVVAFYSDQQPSHLKTARAQFQSALGAQPSAVRAHHGLAVVADLEQQYQEAERHYLLAVALSPDDSNIKGDLGYSYLLQNRLDQAEKFLSQALQGDPSNRNAARHLGDTYARQGKVRQAEETYARIMPPQEVQAALAANAAEPPRSNVQPAAATAEPKSLLSKLTPSWQSEGEKVTAELQRRRDEQVAMERRAGPMPTQPRLPAESRLKEQLAAIDREPYEHITSGPIMLDDQTGQLSRVPGADMARSWSNSAPPMAVTIPSAGPPANDQMRQGVTQAAAQQPASPPPSASPFATRPADRTPQPWTGVEPAAFSSHTTHPGQVDPAFYQDSSNTNANANAGRTSSVPPDFNAAVTQRGPQQPPVQNPQQAPGQQAAPPGGPAPGQQNAFEEASKQAARMGMGMGPGAMFPVFAATPSLPPGTNVMGAGNFVPQPVRMIPINVPPQDLRGAFRPDPPIVEAPATWQGGPQPPSVRPMYSVEQFGTAARYDQRTLETSGAPDPSFIDPGMRMYEDLRWEAGRVRNDSMEKIWAYGPANSPVSPVAGSQYTRPESPGVNFTQTPTGSTLQPPSWPFARQMAEFNQNPNGTSQAGQVPGPGVPPVTDDPNVVVPEPYRPTSPFSSTQPPRPPANPQGVQQASATDLPMIRPAQR